jgi:hypothetical protein
MAVLTGISDAVRAGIAGAAGQAVKAGANAVRNIAGLNKEGSNSALASSIGANKGTSSNILTYPINVDSDPQQGHYIMFMINERIPGKLAKNKGNKNIEKAIKEIADEGGYDDEAGMKAEDRTSGSAVSIRADDMTKKQLHADLQAGKFKYSKSSASGKLNKSIVLEKLPTQRLATTIALYMPPAVQVQYDVKYADKEIGTLAALGAGAIAAFNAGSGTADVLTKITDSLTGDTAKEGLKNLANSALDTIAPGALALSQLQSGSVITPRMEMMFEGVGRRTFSYTFAFLPKSVQEARIVEDIIYHFKFYMMPKYSNPTTRREMDIPGTFDIQYMYKGNQNSFINKVSTCFLNSVQVEYGADRFTAYEETTGNRGKGSPPQKSKITLQFTELEVLSQDHIKEGF